MKKLYLSLLIICTAQNATAGVPNAPIQKNRSNLTKDINTPLVSNKYEVIVATSLPLNGEAAIIAQDILDGMQLYFNKIKQLQPPLNFYVNLAALDDKSSISTARKNIEKLKKQTPLFASLFETETTKCALPSLKKDEILSFFPIEGTETIRNEKLKNQLFLRTSNKNEIRTLVKFLRQNMNKKRFAIFYEDSDWGNDVLESTKKVLAEYKLKPVATGSYQQKTVNITAAVKSIASSAPSAVICIAQARPAYNFICQAINQGLHKTTFAGLSNLFSIQKTLKESRGITILLSSVVPSPFKSDLAIIKEYRKDMAIYLPNKINSPFVLEGYLNAAVLCAILQTSGFPLTIEKILTTIDSLKKFKLTTAVNDKKDMFFGIDESRCLLKKRVWLNTGINKKWIIDKGS